MRWTAIGLALIGCTTGAGDGPAYVLVDAAARQAGVVVELDGVALEAALPVEVDADVELAVIDAGGHTTALWTESGAVHHVAGADPRIGDGWPGSDLSDTEALLDADADVAWALADAIGGTIEVDGADRLIVADDLYPRLAAADLPDGALDLWPVAVEGETRTAGAMGFDPAARAAARDRRAPAPCATPRVAGRAVGTAAVDGPGNIEAHGLGFLGASVTVRVGPARGATAADQVGWYCALGDCVLLGVTGTALTCTDGDCLRSPWSIDEGRVVVDGRFYTVDGDGLRADGGPRLAPQIGLEVGHGR